MNRPALRWWIKASMHLIDSGIRIRRFTKKEKWYDCQQPFFLVSLSQVYLYVCLSSWAVLNVCIASLHICGCYMYISVIVTVVIRCSSMTKKAPIGLCYLGIVMEKQLCSWLLLSKNTIQISPPYISNHKFYWTFANIYILNY